METTYQKIIRKTGAKPSSCKCQVCKSQCQKTPCIGTPEDMARIISAGFGDRLAATNWGAGIAIGLTNKVVDMLAPRYDPQKKSCTFFTDGLCELHTLGLKPTEGKLSSHDVRVCNKNPKKLISWSVAQEWMQFWKDHPEVDNNLISTEDIVIIINHEINTTL